jgi:hypothetical protein
MGKGGMIYQDREFGTLDVGIASTLALSTSGEACKLNFQTKHSVHYVWIHIARHGNTRIRGLTESWLVLEEIFSTNLSCPSTSLRFTLYPKRSNDANEGPLPCVPTEGEVRRSGQRRRSTDSSRMQLSYLAASLWTSVVSLIHGNRNKFVKPRFQCPDQCFQPGQHGDILRGI